MPTSLAVAYSNPSTPSTVEPRDLLALEQEEWSAYVGVVTKAQSVRWMLNLFYGAEEDVNMDCGLTGDNLIVAVYAYPATPDLAYQLHTSWGVLSERVVEEFEHTELVNFTLTNTASTEYPATEILSVSLPTPDSFFDNTGAVVAVTIDDVTIVDGDLQLPLAAWGAVRVTYRVVRHTYILNAPPREDAVEDLFGAVVYGLYDGGFSYLEIEPPPNADELSTGEIECGWTSTGTVTYPDDDDSDNPPSDTGADRHTTIGMCSGLVISDTTYGK